jgi:hypothetical protein
MGSFTVKETLEYAGALGSTALHSSPDTHSVAAFELPFTLSREEKQARIERVVEDVGLKSALNTQVGNIFFKVRCCVAA